MIEEYTGPLAPAIRDVLTRLNGEESVGGILFVVFTRDGKATVVNTIPHDSKVKLLKGLLEAMEPRRLVLAG